MVRCVWSVEVLVKFLVWGRSLVVVSVVVILVLVYVGLRKVLCMVLEEVM